MTRSMACGGIGFEDRTAAFSSTAVLAPGLRKSRYCGVAKTSLQHQLTGAATNLVRITAWLSNIPVAHCFSSSQAE
ncbi:hypothetical protein ACFVXC_06825 [Streptomyces sp. NPDC058257]|uniref:hypothetical protein n=1 Tax=Streptomyces sp. NPDC058257 TaxID=3346409 RepID=UPI0036EF95CE